MNVKQLIIIIGLLLIIIYNSSVSRMEHFENNNTSIPIILFGDSILKNNSYVKPGYAVDELLRKMCSTNPNIKIVNYAREDSTISDVYEQLSNLDDIDYNLKYIVFLSVGGNNILQNYDDVNTIFEKYKKLIDTIKTKLPESKLFLLNLYHIGGCARPLHMPTSPLCLPTGVRACATDGQSPQLNPIIDQWNQLLYNYSSFASSSIVDINKLITSPQDLTFKIESKPTDKPTF